MSRLGKIGLAALAGIAVLASQARAVATWTGEVDNNWSTVSNWTGGFPGTDSSTAVLGTNDTEGIINISGTASGLAQLGIDSAVTTSYTVSGGTLSFDANSSIAVINNSSAVSHTINSDISIADTGNNRNINVGGGLTLNGTVSMATKQLYLAGSSSGTGTYNGNFNVYELSVSGVNGTHVFNNTVDNTIVGQLRLTGSGSTVIVNTADNVNFYDGINIQVNQNGTFILNGANVIGDSTKITVGATPSSFVMQFNANEDLGALNIVSTNGGTVLDLGSDVTSLVFDDSSSYTWGSELVITNFRSGVIGFGTDATGLSSQQLALITAYDAGGTDVTSLLQLDSTGSLVIPEPATIGLLGFSAAVLLAYRRFFRR